MWMIEVFNDSEGVYCAVRDTPYELLDCLFSRIEELEAMNGRGNVFHVEYFQNKESEVVSIVNANSIEELISEFEKFLEIYEEEKDTE